jgi:hypothetical protein
MRPELADFYLIFSHSLAITSRIRSKTNIFPWRRLLDVEVH